MTVLDDVCERIYGSARFRADYEAMVRQSVLGGAGLPVDVILDEDAVRRLVQSAALFAQTAEPRWRQMAYRISFGSLTYQEALGGVAQAARLTLARLGNFPALRFAFNGIPEPKTLTPQVFYEIVSRRAQNTITVGHSEAVLTDMQKAVWDVVASGTSIALSAPTSAGKSFVFQAHIERLKSADPATSIVYLVPTRALITQVATALSRSGADKPLSVVTVPLLSVGRSGETPVYVLTPERLQALLYAEPDLRFDVAIVDEAHLIADGSRGLILHSTLQELLRRKPLLQFLFSSPQVREPKVFGATVGRDNLEVIKTTDPSVAQNIILVNTDPIDNRTMTLSLWNSEQVISLSVLEAAFPVHSIADRLIYSAWSFGAGSQSLVYAQGPAEAEDVAYRIMALRKDPSVPQPGAQTAPSETVTDARVALSDFAKKAVHPNYLLGETVLKGIGFHYGRIPTLLRHAVEESFAAGHLDYIVCTSTLLQGVNLPARNIFMQNPHKGTDRPIDAVDFWNLAGRAGRLGKDFQGNVFLVEYDSWESKPLSGPKDDVIKPALEAAVVDNWDKLLDFVRDPSIPTGAQPLLESAFAKLLRDFRAGQLPETLDRVPALTRERRAELQDALQQADTIIQLRENTLAASPLISGYRQQELYEYMIAKISKEGPDYLVPPHPSSDFVSALNKMRPVFARVHRYLELKPGKHHRYWAPLALRWMRGEALPSIVDDTLKYWKRQGKRRDDRTVIREVLTDIENGLRFRYVNLLGCYIAVLKQALVDTSHSGHVARIPALPLYLELGAASQTMVQLLSFGLSRHAAGRVARLTINRDMDAAAVHAFLQKLVTATAGLSPYVSQEVERVRRSLMQA